MSKSASPEGYSRVLQSVLNPRCGRVLATKHEPRDPFRVLERRHGLAEIVERGAFSVAERLLLTYAFTGTPAEPQIRKALKRWSGTGNCARELSPDFVVLCLTQTDAGVLRAIAKQCAALRKRHPRTTFVLVTPPHKKHATRSALRDFDLAAVEAAKPFDGVVALPIGEATARGVSEGVLAHDAHNSYHYADAGRLYELEMLLNAFAIASRRQP